MINLPATSTLPQSGMASQKDELFMHAWFKHNEIPTIAWWCCVAERCAPHTLGPLGYLTQPEELDPFPTIVVPQDESFDRLAIPLEVDSKSSRSSSDSLTIGPGWKLWQHALVERRSTGWTTV